MNNMDMVFYISTFTTFFDKVAPSNSITYGYKCKKETLKRETISRFYCNQSSVLIHMHEQSIQPPLGGGAVC